MRTALAFLILCGTARADFVDFAALGGLTAPSIRAGSVTATGSGVLSASPATPGVAFAGLAVVGGLPSLQGADFGPSIDPTESVTLAFADPATTLRVALDGNGSFGIGGPSSLATHLHALGLGGVDLGSIVGDVQGPDLVALFGGGPITSLSIAPGGDATAGAFFAIGSLRFTPASAVPEPAAWALLGGGAFLSLFCPYIARARCRRAK